MGVLAALSYRRFSLVCIRARRGLTHLVHLAAAREATRREQGRAPIEQRSAPSADRHPEEEAERLIVTGRLIGMLEPGEYQAMMARLARLDEARCRVLVPENRSE